MSANELEPVEVLGRQLRCLVCGNGEFWHRTAQLNTGIATLFKLDWANRSGTCVICGKCGFIHWFYPETKE